MENYKIRVRTNDLDEHKIEGDKYIVERFDWFGGIEMYPHKKKSIPVEIAYKSMYRAAVILKKLNPDVEEKNLINKLQRLNNFFCQTPLSFRIIFQIWCDVQKNDCFLNPTGSKLIKWGKENTYTKSEKQSIGSKESAKIKYKKTDNKIKECIENWNVENDGKLNNTNISKKLKISKKTIITHLKSG